MIHRSSRVVASLAASVAVGSSCLFLACGGEHTVWDREEVDAGWYGGAFDPVAPSASSGEGAESTPTSSGAGAPPSTVCCETEADGTLSCGTWVSSTPDSCPEGYALYSTGGDAGAPPVVTVDAAVDAGACPVVCPASSWPTPDGLGCCDVESDGIQCTEGSYPPVYEYPVASTFGASAASAAAGGALVCPAGSTSTPDGRGCCTVNRDGYQVCGEYGAARDIGAWDDDFPGGSTLGISWSGGCGLDGLCCPASTVFALDDLGCCTIDSDGFALCIQGGARAHTGEPFFAGSVVPWPWGPEPVCPIPIPGEGDAAP
jgi:hypothetical protein